MFGFIKNSLQKTAEAIKSVAPKKKKVFSKEELEDILLEADVSYDFIELILNEIYQDKVTREILRPKLLAAFAYATYEEKEVEPPFVELIVGVNGAGKTTTIAKLTQHYLNDGKKVILGAADTFRAAAIEQLTLWAEKLGVPIIATKQGHDPSAVAFDTINSAKAKGFDHVIIDTAGRLHTQTNLANELKKIVRICDKCHAGSPHRTILILDGTQGNSAIEQAKAFHEMIGIDGIIITKLDGTAKGGSVFSIAYALELPIFYVGTGEKPEHLVKFDKYEFVDGILDAIFEEEETKKEVPKQTIPEPKPEAASKPEPEPEPKPEAASKPEPETEPETETEKKEKKEQEVELDSAKKVITEETISPTNDVEETKQTQLETFLKAERLILLQKLNEDKILVNYANTPVDTTIIYKDGKWQYLS